VRYTNIDPEKQHRKVIRSLLGFIFLFSC